MLFEKIGLINERFEYVPDMYVGTLGNRILYVQDTPPDEAVAAVTGERFDGRDRVLMPAFYNAHGHSPMSILRGYGENLPLDRWLNERIFPFEAKLYRKAVYWSTLLSMAESVRTGIVSTTDMYNFVDDIVRAVCESGCKTNVGRHIVNFDGSDPKDNPTVKEMRDAILMYDGFMDGRIRTDVNLHAEYTSDEKTVRAAAELAKGFDVRVHVHVSETQKETEECKARRGGMTPTQYLASCGLFDQPATAAHCVWLTDEDREILSAHDVTVASNTVSNLKLVSGICDTGKLLEKGINVAIGTDGVSSNNSLNFFEEIKMFALCGKLKADDPAAMPPEKVLYCATRAGALSQGRTDCGLIKEGFRADLIVVDASGPNMFPVHSMTNNLVYSASGNDVLMTMADGEVLYDRGKYTKIDLEKVRYEVETARQKILASL